MRGQWTGLILGILFFLSRASLMTTSSCFPGISQVVNNGSFAQMNMLTFMILGWVFKWWCTVYKTHKYYLKRKRDDYETDSISWEIKEVYA
jgi:hypothetical protein